MIKKKILFSNEFSSVYLQSKKDTNLVIKKYYSKDSFLFKRELEVLKILNKKKHPCIIRLYKHSLKKLIFKDIGKDLRFFIQNGMLRYKTSDFSFNDNLIVKISSNKDSGTNSLDAKDLILQIQSGLKYIHSKGLVHFDVKPENIIICTGTVKIIDFASAKYNHEIIQQSNFTNKYTSLEYLLGYTKAEYCQDVWSFGCVVYEICTGHSLIAYSLALQVVNQILKIFGSPRNDCYREMEVKHLNLWNIFEVNERIFDEVFGGFNDKWKFEFMKIFNLDVNERISIDNIKFFE